MDYRKGREGKHELTLESVTIVIKSVLNRRADDTLPILLWDREGRTKYTYIMERE